MTTRRSPEQSTATPKTTPEIQIPSNIALNNLSEDALSTITNREFLRINKEDRLRHITNPSIQSNAVTEGTSVRFRFAFGEKPVNRDLYLGTTAGQVLPRTIQAVRYNGTIFERDGLEGEFFSQNGYRLIIADTTSLTIETVKTNDVVAKEIESIGQSTDSYGPRKTLAMEAKLRGIDINFAMFTWGSLWDKTGAENRKQFLEDWLTEFGRVKGTLDSNKTSLVDGKYPGLFAMRILAKYNDDWMQKAKAYGIPEDQITEFTSNGQANLSLEEGTIDNGENLSGEALWNYPAFYTKLSAICSELGISMMDMKAVMIKESGINPKILNRLTGKAVGLIQFMPKTAEGLGTTTGKLRMMSGVDQLDYVRKYFLPYAGNLGSVASLYLATFYPAAIGKGDNYIIGESGGAVVAQNPSIANYGIPITVSSFKQYATARG